MSILATLLFGWIFDALAGGIPPAQFSVDGKYLGTTPHATTATLGAQTRLK